MPKPPTKGAHPCIHHHDGAVTHWHPGLQQWDRTSAYDLMSDEEAMLHLSDADRERVENRGSR